MGEGFRPKTLFEIFGGEPVVEEQNEYSEFIRENQELLSENSALKHKIRLLEFEVSQYKKLISRIQSQINSRENFNEKYLSKGEDGRS
jgi:uncharacterized protein YlxW (UPF0749 family)